MLRGKSWSSILTLNSHTHTSTGVEIHDHIPSHRHTDTVNGQCMNTHTHLHRLPIPLFTQQHPWRFRRHGVIRVQCWVLLWCRQDLWWEEGMNLREVDRGAVTLSPQVIYPKSTTQLHSIIIYHLHSADNFTNCFSRRGTFSMFQHA